MSSYLLKLTFRIDAESMPVPAAFGRLRQEHVCGFDDCLGYIVNFPLAWATEGDFTITKQTSKVRDRSVIRSMRFHLNTSTI